MQRAATPDVTEIGRDKDYMVRRVTALVLAMVAAAAAAQEWNPLWITHPAARPDEQIWFRHTFLLASKPEAAKITIASDGPAMLYINGYNVTTDVPVPNDGHRSDTIAMTRYEVARFLRPDTNVVAVWCSPAGNDSPRLMLTLSGRNKDGNAFAMRADRTWMCRPANAMTTTDGNETIDDNLYIEDWNLNAPQVMGWLHANETTPPRRPVAGPEASPHTAMRIAQILRCNFFDDYGRDIIYRFPHMFSGWVRVTLRDMHRGDTLNVNGLTYICSGRSDEQACRQFTTATSGMALISGPDGFSTSNVTKVEGISIGPYSRRNWHY